MTTHPDALIASDYVVCATLRKVADVFGVDLLWTRDRGGPEGVALLEALRRHPRTPRTRQHRETYYSQVIVRVPERDYVRDDRMEDGSGRRTLVRELSRLHEQELGRLLAENTEIRYRVEPDSTLRPGEVQFLFGRAIYALAAGETSVFRIEAAAEGRDEWRDLGPIYPGQRLTLLNGDRRTSSFPVIAWPFVSGESVLLMLRTEPSVVVDVVAEPPGCLSLTSDGAGGFLARDRRNRGLRLRVTALAASREPSDSPKPLVAPIHTAVTVTELAESPESDLDPEPPLTSVNEEYPQVDHRGRREPVFGMALDTGEEVRMPVMPPVTPLIVPAPPAPPASPALPPASVINQETWIPRRPAAAGLKVLGVALQRLSTYATAGISDWRLSFNRTGVLVLDAHPEAVAWLRIDSLDRIFGEVAGGSLPLNLPGAWRPFPELELEFHAVPQAMAGHYLGWVRLPTPLDLPVPHGRAVSFGRGSEADIAPRLLADPQSLRWEGDPAKTGGISAEYLGLSRRHLCLQARRDDWWVQLESQNMPVYRLTLSGELLDVLTPGVNTATAAKSGELLVVGGYVLALGAVG